MEEEPVDIDELEIILGLKNKKEELKKIIDNSKKSLSFLGAINEILISENSIQLCEKENDVEDNQNNEMINEFIQKFGIPALGIVKIQEYSDKKFLENIKTNDLIFHESKISYSPEYLTKLKREFKEEVEKKVESNEILKQNNELNKSNNKKNIEKSKNDGNQKNKGFKKNKEYKKNKDYKNQNSQNNSNSIKNNSENKNNNENKYNEEKVSSVENIEDEKDEDEIQNFEVIVDINNPDSSDSDEENHEENAKSNSYKNNYRNNKNYQNKKRHGNYGAYNKNQKRGNNNYGQNDDSNYKKNYHKYKKKNK